ncbi:MAG: septum formation protein Maf [Thermoleophilaceae bacterium]|nr:septum formation protein Maf [Thermoleophilaceae bacterium]
MTGSRERATPPRLVLASGSPQRRAILEQLGVAFTVEQPEIDELAQGDPRTVAVENASRKARAVRGELVLGADTVVAVDGRSLGKPADAEEAREFLACLSGRDHLVVTGVALREGDSLRTGCGVTRVRFRALRIADVEAYVATGEWDGRAGGYAIQGRGALLVAEVEGDYWTVVGLPVAELARMEPDLLLSPAG